MLIPRKSVGSSVVKITIGNKKNLANNIVKPKCTNRDSYDRICFNDAKRCGLLHRYTNYYLINKRQFEFHRIKKKQEIHLQIQNYPFHLLSTTFVYSNQFMKILNRKKMKS